MILNIKDLLEKKCGTLAGPMGIKDTEEMNQNVPVVHPMIKVSRDHFIRNTAFVNGRYRVFEEHSRAYFGAPVVQFDDVVGFVLVLFLVP